MAKIKFFLFLLFFAQNIFAANAHIISSIRLWPAANSTRIVLDVNLKNSKNIKDIKNNKLKYTSFTLENPDRLVVDIKDTDFAHGKVIKNLQLKNSIINNLRYSNKSDNLRLVFDLKDSLKNSVEYKLFSIDPNEAIKFYRLVIDIKNKNSIANANAKNVDKKLTENMAQHHTPSTNLQHTVLMGTTRLPNDHDANDYEAPLPRLTSIDSSRKKKFTVVIDPGHGGDDPGAVGPGGTQEKDVALLVAHSLKQYIDQDEDLKAVLTRSNDRYIGLRERTQKARMSQADLFISIHADGYHDTRATGSSVFVLSERGASSELAKWLAVHENSSDLVGGIKLEDKDPMLATVLLDLSQTASNRASYQVANRVLQQMSMITDLHKSNVEKAGFIVLRSPDIPSILIETGFISNPRGERNLSSTVHQQKLAFAIYKGIKSYFKMSPRPSWSDEMIQARR